MRDNVYLRSIDVIKAIRHLDAFTQRHVERLLCFTYSEANHAIKMLVDLGCVKAIGKRKASHKNIEVYHYEVDPMAITKLKVARGKDTEPVFKEKKERDKEDIFCGITVVEKAYIGDMGSPLLKQLDKLLAGVRA